METDLRVDAFRGVNPLDVARPGTRASSKIYAVEVQNPTQRETLAVVKELLAEVRKSADPLLTREDVCSTLGWKAKTFRNRKAVQPLQHGVRNDTMKLSEWREWLALWPKVLERFERAIVTATRKAMN